MEPRDHHYFFAHRFLPAVFYNDPEEFVDYLRRDTTNVLRAVWTSAGSDLELDERLTPLGLGCEIRDLEDQTAIVLITLPEPEVSPEAYFVAAAYRSAAVSGEALVRYFTLECRQPGDDQTPFVCEWVTTEFHCIRSGLPSPDLEAFFRSVCDLLKGASAH
jgi:hypothetical protein